MKTIFKFVLAVVATSMAFVSCQKEVIDNTEELKNMIDGPKLVVEHYSFNDTIYYISSSDTVINIEYNKSNAIRYIHIQVHLGSVWYDIEETKDVIAKQDINYYDKYADLVKYSTLKSVEIKVNDIGDAFSISIPKNDSQQVRGISFDIRGDHSGTDGYDCMYGHVHILQQK